MPAEKTAAPAQSVVAMVSPALLLVALTATKLESSGSSSRISGGCAYAVAPGEHHVHVPLETQIAAQASSPCERAQSEQHFGYLDGCLANCCQGLVREQQAAAPSCRSGTNETGLPFWLCVDLCWCRLVLLSVCLEGSL